MLTQTLRGLERDGMVKRTVFPTNPPSVEYELTMLGGSLLTLVRGLFEWTTQNQAAIARARQIFDERQNVKNSEVAQRLFDVLFSVRLDHALTPG